MADFANGNIQAFLGPKELGTNDNLETVIIEFIRGARSSLDIAVQEIDDKNIAQALIDASWRGVDVRVFIEQQYIFDKFGSKERKEKPAPEEGETVEEALLKHQWESSKNDNEHEVNREIANAFLRNGIDVKSDFNPAIFHQKFIIRDYRGKVSKTDTHAVLTGSTNFTVTGTHSNLNHVVIFHWARICKIYYKQFLEIVEGRFGVINSGKSIKPSVVNIRGVPVRIAFSPEDAPELEIVKHMLKCHERLDFAIFTFSGSSAIDDALWMLHHAQRKIRGVLDYGQGRQKWAASNWLHLEGIDVYLTQHKGDLRGINKLHHKLMVIDDAVVIGGSMNYTAPANNFNDENTFIIGNPFDLDKGEGGPVDFEECAKITKFFRDEIERIIESSALYIPA